VDETHREHSPLQLTTLLVVAVAGLLYVKWLPDYGQAQVAASAHSIGQSILAKAARAPAQSVEAAFSYAWAYGQAIWKAMVLGLLLGSGVQALLPDRWVTRLLGGVRFGGVIAGGLLSLPVMMCTCCAAPVVVGLRQRGAAPGAAVAFWLGNSVLNPATLIFIGFVLGWRWAALRLVLGAAMVFGLGYIANRMSPEPEAAPFEPLEFVAVWADEPPLQRWLLIFWRMTRRLLPEYLILILLLSTTRGWLLPMIGPEIGNQVGWMLAFAVGGALFAIPTAGEVPIIQAMLSLGLGVGPAGVLLMTLPPISLPSLAMLAQSFPLRMLVAVAATVVLVGLVSGALAVALRF
jgi:uncharacterized membrane protein YraQ (UPF0718 family)